MKPSFLLVATLILGCGHSDPSPPVEDSQIESHDAAPAVASTSSTAACATEGGCPLQSWMKSNAAHAMTMRDAKALERAFVKISSLDPGGYPRWQAIADAGRAAAAAGDLEECRAQCKTCHDAYRATYRQTRRADPLRQ